MKGGDVQALLKRLQRDRLMNGCPVANVYTSFSSIFCSQPSVNFCVFPPTFVFRCYTWSPFVFLNDVKTSSHLNTEYSNRSVDAAHPDVIKPSLLFLPSCHRGLPGPPAEETGGRIPPQRQDRRPLHQSRQSLRHGRRDLSQGAGAAAAAGRPHQVGDIPS